MKGLADRGASGIILLRSAQDWKDASDLTADGLPSPVPVACVRAEDAELLRSMTCCELQPQQQNSMQASHLC